MIFRTFEHYNDHVFFQNEKNVCFICYEINNANEYEPVKLNSQTDYIKNCNCNGWIHKKCLNKWYNKSRSCPICRIYVNKRLANKIIILEKDNRYFLINIYKITSYLYLLFFLYYIFNFYVLVITGNYNDNLCSS